MNYDIENPPKPITIQWIFDVVSNHLLTQNKKAQTVQSYTCSYRTPDGLKCAGGCLIPDKLYDPIIENSSVPLMLPNDVLEGQLKLVNIFRSLGYDENHSYFIKAMQDIHDYHEPIDWRNKLTNLALTYGLTINFPEKIKQ